MREAGIALVLASLVLAAFLFIPLASEHAVVAQAPVLATSTPDASFTNVPLSAKAAIVYDLTDGKTLYAKNAHAQLPLASLTKLLTLYSALKELSPDTVITIPQNVMGLSEPHAFSPGESFTLQNLARITLTASLNDGAAAIAEAASSQEHRSIHQMIASAAAGLDLAQTYAVNGNGLDMNTAISGGYGSAHDIAVVAGQLATHAQEIVSATTHPTASAVSEQGVAFTVKNTDPIVGAIPGLMLSKTGYTDLAGGNLALVFDVGLNHPVAVVILGSTLKARFTDGAALVAATYAHFAHVRSL